MANACLDGLAAAAADAGLTTCSMQLPLIAEAGMDHPNPQPRP